MSLALLGSEQFTRQVDRTEFYFFPVLVAMLSSFGTIKLNLSCVHMGVHANFKKKYCLGFFFFSFVGFNWTYGCLEKMHAFKFEG